MAYNEEYMLMALNEARLALENGEAPVGCVIVRDGQVLAKCRNRREESRDPTAHAEILAIREAANVLGDWRLANCEMYVTLEPCPMCAGAIVMARIKDLYYAADDEKYGCAGSVYRITEDSAFGNFTPAYGGFLAEESKKLLDEFFSGVRKKARGDG